MKHTWENKNMYRPWTKRQLGSPKDTQEDVKLVCREIRCEMVQMILGWTFMNGEPQGTILGISYKTNEC